MTEITYRPREHSMVFNGHARYAEAGKDIVCAGISSLMYAAPEMLRKKDIKYFLDLNEPEGFIHIKAYPEGKEEKHDSAIILGTVAEGLKLMAEHYPDNVKFTKEVI